MGNANSTDISFAELSAIGARAQQSEISGTSFLDLPPELREMIYDLCAPKSTEIMFYELPLQSKPTVVGINLLRCSKQIHDEVSQRLDLWDAIWVCEFSSPSLPEKASPDIDCSLAFLGLNDLTLAKITGLDLRFSLGIDMPTTFALHGLEVLLKLTSLEYLCVHLNLEFSCTSAAINNLIDQVNLPFVKGVVVHIIAHVPTSVPHIGWFISYPRIPTEGTKILRKVVKQYKSVQGSAYVLHEDSDSSSSSS
jgi:hypothetical protein